jgi:PAS domain S-box-containing protein
LEKSSALKIIADTKPTTIEERKIKMNEHSTNNQPNSRFTPHDQFDMWQNFKVVTGYIVAVIYGCSTQYLVEGELTRDQHMAYWILTATMSVLVSIDIYMYFFIKRYHTQGELMKIHRSLAIRFHQVNLMFVVMALIQITVVMFSFRTKPPALFTHLTPFLSMIICHSSCYMILSFSGILVYALLLQFAMPPVILECFKKQFCSSLFGGAIADWQSHFEYQMHAIEQDNYQELKILFMQEIAMFCFFAMIIFHYRSSKQRLFLECHKSKHKAALITAMIDSAPMAMWSWNTNMEVSFSQGMYLTDNTDGNVEPNIHSIQDVLDALNIDPTNHEKLINAHKLTVSKQETTTLTETVNDIRFKITIMPWCDQYNQLKGGIALAMNVSDLLEAQESLQSSEENYRSLVQSIDDVIIKIDNNYNILYANQEFNGLSTKELEKMNLLEMFNAADLKNTVKDHLRALFKNKLASTWEWNLSGKNAEDKHLLSTKVTPIIKDDTVIAATVLISDMTDRVVAEQAAIASRAKSHFIASISHDIRNPIHAILSLAQLLLETHNVSEIQQEYIDDVILNSKLLLSLIRYVSQLIIENTHGINTII